MLYSASRTSLSRIKFLSLVFMFALLFIIIGAILSINLLIALGTLVIIIYIAYGVVWIVQNKS